MNTAKVFKNGRSQAVRIPRQYRLTASEVIIKKQGDNLILTPVNGKITVENFLSMPKFPDFAIDRKSGQKIQKRKLF